MTGRNAPCPCGSNKKYKKCCERVVAFSIAKQTKCKKEKTWFVELHKNLIQWFQQRWSYQSQNKWSLHYKQLLQLPLNQPIPQQYTVSFHYWLLFDARCMASQRPVDQWLSTVRIPPEKERLIHSFKDLSLSCYEVLDIRNKTMCFRSLLDDIEFEIHKEKEHTSFVKGHLIFTRLLRLGNHYQLVGPYTSFVHEMRGEILVQLEEFNHQDEESQEYTTRNHIWRVLGYSVKRAEELERIEKLISSSDRLFESAKESAFLDLVETKEPINQGLPLQIMQHIEQFFVTFVSSLQKKTQALYGDSMERLFRFLSERFGQVFEWKHLDEENLTHFLTVWYLDRTFSTPAAAKIFLNTIKNFFRWLASEQISDVYVHVFKKVYISLIRVLPVTTEARKWLRENAVSPDMRNKSVSAIADLYQLTISPSGPMLLVGNKWVSVQLNGFPPMWSENRFWIRGSIQKINAECVFTHIDNVYPAVQQQEETSIKPSLRYIENN